MTLAATAAAIVSILFHLAAFVLESIGFTKPSVYRRFLITSAADAAAVRPMALNQGFYNLFLAIGAAIGLVVMAGQSVAGRTLLAFASACMAAAGVVLLCIDRRFLRTAAIQAVPPVIVLLDLLGAY